MPFGALTDEVAHKPFALAPYTAPTTGLPVQTGLFPGDHTKLLATSDTAYKGFGNACANGLVFGGSKPPPYRACANDHPAPTTPRCTAHGIRTGSHSAALSGA